MVVKTSSKPSENWHPADVGAALKKSGTNLSRLAAEHGFSRWTLRDALRRPYPKAEAIIATALGFEPQDIWPGRYHPDGSHKGGSAKRESSTHSDRRNVEKRTQA